MMNIKGTMPTRGSASAAGYDIYSNADTVIPPRSRGRVTTGLFMEIPEGFYGDIRSRSGLAVKNCIDVCAGIIDSDYRGEIVVVLANHSDVEFQVTKGMKVAQMLFKRYWTFDFNVVEELDSTARGDGGFGSTGK